MVVSMLQELVERSSSVAAVVSAAYTAGVVAQNVVLVRDTAVGTSCWSSSCQVAGSVVSESKYLYTLLGCLLSYKEIALFDLPCKPFYTSTLAKHLGSFAQAVHG